MVEKGIRGGICYAAHKYKKANSKHMKDDDPSTESSYLRYFDVNNLCGWAVSQKLPEDGFKGYIFDVDVSYLSAYRRH